MTALVGSWTLRFRFQGKVSSIPNLIGPDTKYIQLKQLLTEKGNVCFGIDPNQLRFRGGFPPRVIQLSDNESISKNNLIRNKDMLHVELIDNNGNRIPVASPNGSNSSSGGSSNNNGGKRNNNNNRTTIKNKKIISSIDLTKNTLQQHGEEWIPENDEDIKMQANVPVRRSARERKPSERQYILPPDEKKKKKRKRSSNKTSSFIKKSPSSTTNNNMKKKVGVHTLNSSSIGSNKKSASTSSSSSSSRKKWRGMKGRGRRIGIAHGGAGTH